MVNNKKQKVSIFIALLFFVFFPLPFIFAQSAAPTLEIQYPEVFGAKPILGDIAQYVKYIFNLSIALVGLIAFGVLVAAGMRYLTSAGKPEVLSDAKKRIKGASWGIILLLLSYLILTTINPQLVIFKIPGLIAPKITELPPVPTAPTQAPDVLGRVRDLVNNIAKIAEGIKDSAQEIEALTQGCDCQRTQAMCLCTGGKGGSCEPVQCYAGPSPDTSPCQDIEKIKAEQQKIILFLREIFYYRNRITAERADLLLEINQIKERVAYFEKRIAGERKVLAQTTEENARKLQENIISDLEWQLNNLRAESLEKERLAQNLEKLAQIIESIAGPAERISRLPDECLSNVSKQCKASCSGGCHDSPGCFPAGCSGGNPCPVEEISKTTQDIEGTAQVIIESVKEILSGAEIAGEAPKLPKPPPVELCKNPQELAKINNVPYPRKNAPETERILSCIKSGLAGENLGEISTYDKTYDICNYTKGQRICGTCSHSLFSCHYGGAATGAAGSLAIDFGNEKIGDRIIRAAQECGIKSGRCESGNGIVVSCNDSKATHVHITVNGCDKN